MNAYKVFSVELHRIRQLHQVSSFAFSEVRGTYIKKLKSEELSPDEMVTLPDGSGEIRAHAIVGKLKTQAPKYFRELLFTRIISTLEVYLIELIREVGEISPEKLNFEKDITYKWNQINNTESLERLRGDFIDKECRALSSGGLDEIVKFYSKVLDLDFSSYEPGLNKLKEFHDRRHMLIHRLGKTDEHYKHKYNTDEKILTITEDYINEVIDSLEKFAGNLNKKSLKRVFGELNIGEGVASFNFFVFETQDTENLPKIFNPDYKFNHGDEKILLKQIQLKLRVRKGKIQIIIGGEKEILKSYRKSITGYLYKNSIATIYANPKSLLKKIYYLNDAKEPNP